MFSLIAGIATGSLHVISGPDHLAAVTPLALSARLRSWFIGLSWGAGHVLGALIIGGIFIFLRDYIPVDLISGSGERIVGWMLIIIGVWAFYRLFVSSRREHGHTHPELGSASAYTALSVGIIHGVAGVTHIIGILPTLALPSRLSAAVYLAGFGAGTIITMTVYSTLMGWVAQRSLEHNRIRLNRRINLLGGIFAIITGIYWIGHTL